LCRRNIDVANAEAPAPRVRAIYPRSPVVPENLLRFYVYFTEPMAEGDFLEHIQLRDLDSGEVLTGVFFDNLYELWTPDRKRITLLVDPGRVKTGLDANQRFGRAFVAGHRYGLDVLPTWKSISGVPLGEGYTHCFRATSEDRERIKPNEWTLELPETGTIDGVTVQFHKTVDHVSVGQFLRVLDNQQRPVPGRWLLSPADDEVTFVPTTPWRGTIEEYVLEVALRFEDVVGNNVNASFDHTATDSVRSPGSKVVYRAFR
ncbi:MAG: hypothetical protein AAFY60_09780, partial [Myxococcota bacterium]